jgi:two-component system sensor histidine kinase YcbA
VGKDSHFSSQVSPLLPALHVFTLLSLLGNLASNAVEAIKEQGLIIISFDEENDHLLLKVQNIGSFISPRRLSQVCRPGYTTKFDSQGRASSGVGLSYVQQQAASLGGTFTIESDGREWVACRLRLPLSALRQQPRPEASPLPSLREAALRDAARASLEKEKEAHEKGDSL